MQVVAFRHVPFEDLGLIGAALEARRIEIAYADAFSTGPMPDWRQAAGLVFMGGPMSANDDLPFIHRELEIIRQAVALDRPVLGVCLGAQLLARALGARVYHNTAKEIGWAPVYWTGEARRDPLLNGMESPETLFHWHGETFDVPAGAEHLAWSDTCRNQALTPMPILRGWRNWPRRFLAAGLHFWRDPADSTSSTCGKELRRPLRASVESSMRFGSGHSGRPDVIHFMRERRSDATFKICNGWLCAGVYLSVVSSAT
jgi:GMP synthase-like glutamine amidotransferase